ncbi:MAG: ABC transporter permease [Candidatus Bathyarchaeota archaeon]|nr:ABC transporter permease [Candidatus Bathyarchaeota archaeon]
MGLRGFIIKRIINSLIILLLVILANYVIFMLMPGDPTDFLMAAWSKESPEQRMEHERILKDMWGLNDPPHVQFFKYLRNLLTWNFGIEIAGRRPIGQIMATKVQYTVLLLGLSTILSIVIGVILGIAVIQRRGSVADSVAVIGSLIVGSLPTFWLGLIFLWVFCSTLKWFPGARAFPAEWAIVGYPKPYTANLGFSSNTMQVGLSLDLRQTLELVGGYASHLFLPLLTLTVFSFGGWLLLTRATMLEAITEDYIVTARAKGLDERTVLYKHAFKNASLPIITSAALAFGFVLSGAIITETVFSYPGIGGWIWEAISYRDYPVLMAVFYVISLCVIVANIIADLLYGVVDPRIKYG